MGGIGTHRLLGLGVGLSLLVHLLTAVTLRVAGGPAAPVASGDTDIELAPEAPEAHVPQPGSPDEAPGMPDQAQKEPEPEAEPEPAGTMTEDGEEEVAETSADAAVIAMTDAGVADDATMLAEADAGAGDAGTQIAMGDAGADGDGGMLAGVGGDAGAVASSDTQGDGTGAGPSFDIDPYDGKPPPGAAANLLSYFPQGEKVSVLIRLDRFRGTMWSRRLDKILQPMPDYSALVGTRQMVLADEFDSISISSPQPRDATATTVMVRHRRTPPQMRTFLGRGGAPVTWRTTRGGALGVRGKSPMLAKGDKRVFLLPFPQLALLARPEMFGRLTQPAPGSLDAFPRDTDLPEWMRRVKGIELESGDKSGPAVVITIDRLPRNISVPRLGKIAGPDRLTVSMEIVKGGVLVRGNMLFTDEKRAQSFTEQALKWKEFFTGSFQGKLFLAPFHAYNAVKGLTVKRAGSQVGYATSISVADFQAMTDYGAELTRIYFKQMAEDAAAAEKGKGGAATPPGTARPPGGAPPRTPPAPPGGPSGPPG